MIIETKVLGQRRRPFEPWELELFADTHPDAPTLRELLTRIVQQEVAAFNKRRQERRLHRVLSPDEIETGKAAGRVTMGGREPGAAADPEAAVATALTAFGDGFYYVFVDEVQIETLDTRLEIRPDSRVLFVRLVPLAGG